MGRSINCAVGVACLAAVSCGPKGVDSAKGPSQTQTVAEATGRTTVLVVDGPGTPLIVDWNPEQRADLEVAMREGVPAVAYDGASLQLLKDCRIDGTYGFVGVTTKSQVIQLESEEEIRANLPLAGAGLVVKLGADLERGSTVDVAMVIVGKSRTTWISPTADDLEGSCEGATHFVRGATVGAFVLDTGTKTEARTAAQLFGVGAEAGRGRSKDLRNQDGSLEACNAAKPHDPNPPPQCAALIRFELNPIAKGAAAISKKAETRHKLAEAEAACPRGMVMTGGKCTPQEGAEAYKCSGKDEAECEEQCSLGSGDSCDILGILQFDKDQKRFVELVEKACDLGSTNGCFNHGIALYNGFGTTADRAAAFKRFKQACQDGMALGCSNVGLQYFEGDGVGKDTSRAALYYRFACDGGAQDACVNLGVLYMGGDGVPNDPATALSLFKRACQGGDAVSCGNVGLYVEFGIEVPQDKTLAVKLFERSCRLDPNSCSRLAIVHQTGFSVPQDDARAKELYTKVCTADGGYYPNALACSMLNVLYGEKRSVDTAALSRIVPVMKPQCDQNVARACGFLGAAYLGLGDDTAARAYLERACQIQDYWACDIQKRLPVGR